MTENAGKRLLRTQRVQERTGLSNTQFYVRRALPPDDPEKFPEPDAFLNRGHTPVWLESTVDAWIDAQVEHARADRRKQPTSRRSPATVLSS